MIKKKKQNTSTFPIYQWGTNEYGFPVNTTHNWKSTSSISKKASKNKSRKTVYKSISGNIYTTEKEAVNDNKQYLSDPLYRFNYKSTNLPHYDPLFIPFIEDKRVTLSDAGLATGAVISTNLLDSIAKYAEQAGLPIKTALGLATKESTLGNPTDDSSVVKLIGKDKALAMQRGQTGQHLNTTGAAIDARELVNYYKDTWNPYEIAIEVAKRKSSKLVPDPDGNVYDSKGNIVGTRFYHDDPGYEEYKQEKRLAEDKRRQVLNDILLSGEKYADNLAEKYKDKIKGNILEAAFVDYKNNPHGYNPGQPNYSELVERRASEVWNSPEVQAWYNDYKNQKADGGSLNSKTWNDLSLSEKSEMIRVAVENGITTLPEIRKAYNEFAEGGDVDTINTYETGGNLYSGEESHSSQMNQGHVYDVLPKMLKEAGLDVRVTSGYRKAGQAGNAGSKSWHTRHGAVDIVPQGKTTFEDIENALYNNPAIADYMLKNGFGLIDESGRSAESRATMKKTGATGAHFHIGKDSLAVKNYNNRASSLWDNKMHQLQATIQQPIEQVAPEFTPFNPQAFSAFMGVDGSNGNYTVPQVVDVEEPLVQAAMESVYSPEQIEREERAQGLRNLGLAMSIMRGGQEQSYSPLWSAVSMLSGNQMAKGGKIHIKPENRGKFTALKERTGHSATWFKQHGTPAQKKMATFALNSKKWKHSLGGNLFSGEDTPTQQMNSGLNLYKRTNNLGETEYIYQETPDSEEILLTPTNKRFSDDPTNWDYKDANGREYTPRMDKPAVPQAELRPYEPSWFDRIKEATGYKWLVNKSNEYYNDDLLGIPARWAASWDNNTNPIKALWNSPFAYSNIYSLAAKAADDVLLNPNGLQKTIDLYNSSSGSHADRYAWQSSLLGDVFNASMMLPAASKAAKSMYNGATRAVENYGYPLGRPQVPEGYITVKPQIRTKIGDVEIDNPGLYYHQSAAGKAENFVSTGRMRTPLEESWLAKEAAGEHIPIMLRTGVKPGYPQTPGRAMFAQGRLWYGLDPRRNPDLLVTAEEMPIATSKAGVMSRKASLRKLEDLGSRRVTDDNIYGQGPHNTQNTAAYTWEPGYGYRRVFAEETPTAEWPMGRTFSQITAENAASTSGVMADASDFTYRGSSDLLDQLRYNRKIHGKPLLPSDEGVGGFSKSVQIGLPEKEQNELLHDVVNRNVREFMNAGLSEDQVSGYISKTKDAMNNVHIGMYSNSDYIKGGWEGFGGFYDSEGNFISVNTGSPLSKTKVVKHEGRHLLDHKVDDDILMSVSENFGKDFDSDMAFSTMQKVKQNQNMILYDAYDNDFMTLPSKEGFNEGLEGYSNMDREAITTNLDSRNELLGSKADWDLDITDKIIDKMPDNAIFEAVEKANGYGRRYIHFLRDNNKLTPEKAKQFREAMKHVGAYAAPSAIAAGALYKEQE